MSSLRKCPVKRLTVVTSLILFVMPQILLAEAGELARGEVQYVRRVWQTEDGLRNPAVRAITQCRNGYLWLGTEEGLVRFDGVRFTEMETKRVSETHSRWFVGLTETSDGSIWTSSSNGGVSRIKGGELIRYTTANGLPDNFVLTIFEDRTGTIWFGSAGGLTRYDGGGRFYTFGPGNGWTPTAIRAIAEDREGALWLGTYLGLTRLKDGEFTNYTKENGELVDNSVMGLHVDRDANLWIGTAGGLTLFREDGTRRHFTMSDGLAHDSVRTIYQDRHGAVWVGSHGGLQQIKEGEFRTVAFTERMSAGLAGTIPDFVYSFFEDKEGTLWAGTNLGLNQLNLQKFRAYSVEEGLPHDLTTTVYEDRDENMWVATWGGGLSRIRDGEIETWTMKDGLGSDHVLALHQDSKGNLWVGTDGSGVYRFAGGEFTRYRFAGGRGGNTIRAIHEDRRGRLWAGGNVGLSLLVDGVFRPCERLFGLKLETVRVIVEDADGVIWIGSANGLTRLDGEKFHTYTTADGLSSTTVLLIYPDAGGVLWVATEGGGLNRFLPGGKVTVYTATRGLFRERILHLLEDDSGFFWMSSRSGVFRVSKKELNDFADGTTPFVLPISYGRADGMRRAQCNGIAQPSGWKSRDSRLWFPTMSGVVVFDPTKTRINEIPPAVIIERIAVGGEEAPLAEDLRIPPGQGRLEVDYTATSLQVPEKVRFKYMLEGFDSQWQDAGDRRTAVYQNLAPGEYRFRVTASNNDGVWNEAGADFSFVLDPHFYQTYWFMTVCAIGLAASGAGAYALRVRWMRRRNQELTRLVNERTRKLQEEIRERVAAQRRTAAFSRLGQQLSLASTQIEAARTIVAIADELIGWDSCGLHSYSSETDIKTPVLYFDLVNGHREEVHEGVDDPEIRPMMRRTIDEGAQLLLRKKTEFEPGFKPFGDTSRPSASLMFAPMRKGTSVVGVLSAHSYSFDAFDQRDLDTLQALADYCGGAFERIRTEEALRESQHVMLHQERLAAIGQLSSGAAHEFNNILTIIKGHSCLLLDQEELKPPMIESLREISSSADRAANLTRQLLTFSRKQFMRPRVLNLNTVIREVASMLGRLLGERIVVDCQFAPDIPAIRADPGMMEQIIMNLGVNARDAMVEKGGKLTITTGDARITGQNPHPEARAGHFVSLSVSDTGCGMDPATLRRIFEPFFTTKGVGEGTGLGLASVYGIVKQHRGWIEVSSKAGKGTRFDVYLPATDEDPSEAESTATGSGPSFSGARETILLVEDETGLRKLVQSYLSAMEYSVLEASDGVEALRIWQERDGQIDLLLTDMVLPGGVSGGELAERLREQKPGLTVILTSGYSHEILRQDSAAMDGSMTFIPKPYAPAKLAAMIRARLDKKNGR